MTERGTRRRPRDRAGSAVASARAPDPQAASTAGARPAAPSLALVPLDRQDGALAGALGLGALALYAATACRTFYVGDAPELAAAAAVFGIPHPPGYPLFTVLTGVLARLVPGDRGLAANLVAALYAALAVALAALLSRRLGTSRPAAAFVGGSLAAGATFWAQGTAIEVYGFDVVLGLGAAHLALSASRAPRALALAALAASLWVGHRPLNVVYAPTLVGLALAAGLDPRALARTRAAWAAALAGAVPYAWLPLRSLADPAIDVGDPETLGRFLTVVRAAPYTRHWLAAPMEVGAVHLLHHLTALPRELGLAAPLGAIGLGLVARAGGAERRLALALGWTLVANAAVGLGYHVLDYAAYFLPSTVALALASGLGLERVLRRTRSEGARQGAQLLALGAVLALGASNFGAADLSAHRLARLAAEDTLEAAPEGALVLVEGDTSIHALWFLQAVEGARPDVLVLSPGHVSAWYVEALRARYPDEPWPRYEGAAGPTAHARAIVRALAPRRAVLATPSVALETYTSGIGLGAFPRGRGSALVPVGTELDLEAHADFSERYFERAMARVLPRPEEVDVETASLYLEYALALSRAGDLFARSSRPELGARLHRWVLELRPDALDALVRADVRDGLGEEIPALGLEARARAALGAR